MCLDPTTQTIYLHGGWDGTKDLADLWSYDIKGGVWTCLCQDTSLVVSVQAGYAPYLDNTIYFNVYMSGRD